MFIAIQLLKRLFDILQVKSSPAVREVLVHTVLASASLVGVGFLFPAFMEGAFSPASKEEIGVGDIVFVFLFLIFLLPFIFMEKNAQKHVQMYEARATNTLSSRSGMIRQHRCAFAFDNEVEICVL